MADPWVHIIGLGEDGLEGLTPASRAALDAAEIVFGGPRHLDLAGLGASGRGQPWPVPFSVAPVLAARGKRVAVLASGDPFWHGAGGSLTRHLTPSDWIAHPAPSCFSLAAARLGWKLEDTLCLGLHAAPLTRLRPQLAPGQQILCTLRDGAAAGELAAWLQSTGWGDSALWVMEALGGPRERITETTADNFALTALSAPVLVAVQPAGGAALPRTPGLPDMLFAQDGQITKAPVRALTLAALAPRPGEHLWDLGAGSGSVSVEWCLAGGTASAVETRPDRVPNIRANALSFGVDHRLTVHHGTSLERVPQLPQPQAVFIGGGGDAPLLAAVWAVLPNGGRLVINAVTLETEALVLAAHAEWGGSLLRIDLAQAAPLGRMRGWTPARPLVQWSVTKCA
jgi:precorrin-6B C5,15-methyltransferase / cobalt-precorrin-6B C5,C15-methyltransferase